VSKAAQKWAEQARYDLATARAMLATGRYLYVLFCCQQAVEKSLKALIVERTGDFPPRIHSLPRLVETLALELNEERMDFLAELSVFYIQTRYPEEMEPLAATAANREKAASALRKTEETVEWLLSMLK
jgi:HEPN domain-containing protein